MPIADVTAAGHARAGVIAARHPRDAHRCGDCAPPPTRCPSFRRPRIPSTGLLGNNHHVRSRWAAAGVRAQGRDLMDARKLSALYGLKWNPFLPDIPVEALCETPRIQHFAWRIEDLVMNGGFALVTGDVGAG